MRTTITQNRDTFHAMFLVNGQLVELSTCFWKIMSSRFFLLDVCDRAKIFVPTRDVSTHGDKPAYWFVRDLRNERIKNISQIFHRLKYSIKNEYVEIRLGETELSNFPCQDFCKKFLEIHIASFKELFDRGCRTAIKRMRRKRWIIFIKTKE